MFSDKENGKTAVHAAPPKAGRKDEIDFRLSELAHKLEEGEGKVPF